MTIKILKTLKYALLISVIILITLIGIKIYYILKGPQLQPWHTFVPQELSVEELNQANWNDYLDCEGDIFDAIFAEVVEKTPKTQRTVINRYFQESIIYPPSFQNDWNRSYTLVGPTQARGAAVVLHGLTDSPYSLRHIAELYNKEGFVVLGLRVPGHGTVPAGLSKVTWQQWSAATALALREAKAMIPPHAPLHVAGFSNGGALAVKYALDAVEDDDLPQVDQVVLISPMLGITRLAPLAEAVDMLAMIPGLEKSTWLGITPEFNPFKYNSFPVNAVRQARLLLNSLRSQIT
ncbi:MAG: alpha/beta hydrolase, partial [Candidatus Adiutrix sp.]